MFLGLSLVLRLITASKPTHYIDLTEQHNLTRASSINEKLNSADGTACVLGWGWFLTHDKYRNVL